jgi:hypothetical protein
MGCRRCCLPLGSPCTQSARTGRDGSFNRWKKVGPAQYYLGKTMLDTEIYKLCRVGLVKRRRNPGKRPKSRRMKIFFSLLTCIPQKSPRPFVLPWIRRCSVRESHIRYYLKDTSQADGSSDEHSHRGCALISF